MEIKIVTCRGCTADGSASDQVERRCRELRGAGLCQRQVYQRCTLASILADLIARMMEAGADIETVKAALSGGGMPLEEWAQ